VHKYLNRKESTLIDERSLIFYLDYCFLFFLSSLFYQKTLIVKMLSDEAFQRLLYDLFCTWHNVQRHYDPPRTESEAEKMIKIKSMLCKLIDEISARVRKVQIHVNELTTSPYLLQDLIEEWAMLTWNVLCISSRLQNNYQSVLTSSEDKQIYSKLNSSLVELVNCTSQIVFPDILNFDLPEFQFKTLSLSLGDCMQQQYNLYKFLKVKRNNLPWQPSETEDFAQQLHEFSEHSLVPFIEMFKTFSNEFSTALWSDVRAAQVKKIIDLQPIPDEPVTRLVSFYSHMVYALAILGARLQGFRYELTLNKIFGAYGNYDPIKPLSDTVFSALELLMADCVLCTEPSTDPILVTNNLFPINCGALARGVVFKQFDVQLVTEEVAEHIQSEMRRQKLLQQPSPIQNAPSAALLAMKPATGTKRANNSAQADSSGNTSHKKSDVNSKDIVTIYPVYHTKNRYWAATYPHLLCTTRQKGRQSTHSSYQDLSPSGQLDAKNNGKRPIFYFHIHALLLKTKPCMPRIEEHSLWICERLRKPVVYHSKQAREGPSGPQGSGTLVGHRDIRGNSKANT
jgi:hypothetical protein